MDVVVTLQRFFIFLICYVFGCMLITCTQSRDSRINNGRRSPRLCSSFESLPRPPRRNRPLPK